MPLVIRNLNPSNIVTNIPTLPVAMHSGSISCSLSFEGFPSATLEYTGVSQELVDDTVMEVGSEAYAAGLVVYNYAKASGKGAGLDAVVDEMGRRFARKSRNVQPQASAL